ncbi:hypothetical protein D3C87_1542000 [compost metagenome]
MHHEAAITGKADDFALGKQLFGGDRCRQAIAHGAGGRSGLGVVFLEAMEAVQPGGVVACAVCEDRIVGDVIFNPGHDRPHMDLAGTGLRRRRPFEIGVVHGRLSLGPKRQGRRFEVLDRRDKFCRAGADRKVRAIHAANLFRIREDMDEFLARVGDVDQRVAG